MKFFATIPGNIWICFHCYFFSDFQICYLVFDAEHSGIKNFLFRKNLLIIFLGHSVQKLYSQKTAKNGVFYKHDLAVNLAIFQQPMIGFKWNFNCSHSRAGQIKLFIKKNIIKKKIFSGTIRYLADI